jgi:hypothetical protein
MKFIKILILLGQLIFLGLYNYYCYRNPGNRTAEDFVLWGILSLIFGTSILLTSKLRPNLIGKTDKLIIVIFIISIFTSINIFVFDYFNVMVEYEEWFHRNGPEKPFWRGYKH